MTTRLLPVLAACLTVACLVVPGPGASALAQEGARPPKPEEKAGDKAADKPTDAPAAPATSAEPARPCAVIVTSDAETTVTLNAGAVERTVTLKPGENRIEMPAGHFAVHADPARARIEPAEGDLGEPGQEVRVTVKTRGHVTVTVAGEGRAEVDGKPLTAKEGKAEVDLPAGEHSLIVKQPGYFGTKGALAVAPGRTAEVVPRLEKFSGGGNPTLAWAGILGGGALIVAAISIDAFSKYDQIGGDATRWTLLGLGSVGFVGGTILLKSAIDAEASPPVRDGSFDVKVSAVRGGAVAQVGGTF